MVELIDLPEEIIIMIIKELDFRTLQSMYNCCERIRNIVCMHGVIKECNISMNVMATANTLKLNLFKDISNHLLELNMCGVPDLYKTKVLPAFKKLKNLKTLDISYTNLHILDLMEIHSVCMSLKNIAVNFLFGPPGQVNLTNKTLTKCQTVFESFENVHFFGSLTNLLISKLALYILEKSRLHTLKYSIVEGGDTVYSFTIITEIESQIPHFNEFDIFLLNWNTTHTYECISKFPVLSIINFKDYEFLVISMLNMYAFSVCATPMFKDFFHEQFNVIVQCVTEYDRNLLGNVSIMIWNKETTNFDDIFFHKLRRRLKPYFPHFFSFQTDIPVPEKYDWFYTEPRAPNELIKHEETYKYESRIKKRRIAMPNLVLNYDNVFKEKQKLELSLVFSTHITAAITLSPNCDYLRKLTFLSICGSVCYSSEFFNILFRCCYNLVTLNMEAPTVSPCAANICRSLPLSRSLKNIRLVEKRIDFNTIFSSFSQCQTLENIHILDHGQWQHCQIADPSILLKKCDNLYSIFIEGPFAETALTKQLQLFNKAKIRCEKYNLKVVINEKSIHSTFQYNYDPFVDVFKLNPIKPV